MFQLLIKPNGKLFRNIVLQTERSRIPPENLTQEKTPRNLQISIFLKYQICLVRNSITDISYLLSYAGTTTYCWFWPPPAYFPNWTDSTRPPVTDSLIFQIRLYSIFPFRFRSGRLFPSGLVFSIFRGTRSSFILCTWPSHLSRLIFMNMIVFGSL